MKIPLSLLLLAAPAAAQTMTIEGCNLGCLGGAGGQIVCTTFEVHTNLELRLRFTKPVDLATVDSSSFRIVNLANGSTPTGQFFIEPADVQVVVFRPRVTFDAAGNPTFGFEHGTAYQITLPGVNQGDSPPFVQALDGDPNWNRWQCIIYTTLGYSGPVQPYCSSAPNSAGAGAFMEWSGSTRVTSNDLTLGVSGAVPMEFGLFLLSTGRTQVPAGAGFRCVGGFVGRLLPIQVVGVGGGARRHLDLTNLPPGLGAALPGTVWTTQFAYRDTPAGGAFNFSDGLRLMLHP